MIFHLMIVDDEIPIRRGLSEYIDWASYNCEVVATAINGKDAIDKIESLDIDIVVTDIKMPTLDGIGLAKYIYENHPGISVIILSGYSEFEYAQSAIQYNVEQYLLKPASKEDVIEAVKKAADKLITSKERSSINESEQAFLKDQLFQKLSESKSITEALRNMVYNFQINLDSFYIAAFQPEKDFPDINDLKDMIIDHRLNGYCFRYYNLIMTIYYSDDEPSITPVLENCEDILKAFQVKFSQSFSVGVSKHHSSLEEFSTAASEAINALSINFYSYSHIVNFSDDYMACSANFSVELTLLLHELETAILHLDFKSTNDIITNLFNNLQRSFTEESSVRNICTQIYLICFRVILGKYNIPLEGDYLDTISKSLDIFQLKKVITDLLIDVQKLLTQSLKKYSSFVEETMIYVKNHLDEDLSLEKLASNVHINNSYFSRTFKKECGHSVVTYITMLRISKAKELLASSTLKTFEISDIVGIHDPAYFSILFKKNTGLSPKAYRDQFTNE